MTLSGDVLWEKDMKVTLKPLTSEKLFAGDIRQMIGDRMKGDVIFTTEFTASDTPEPYRNVAYAVRQKYMNYPSNDISVDVAAAGDGYDVTLGSDNFARGVFMSLEGIDNFFSDNYFNLLPGEKRTIHVRTPLSEADFKKQLKIKTLASVNKQPVA